MDTPVRTVNFELVPDDYQAMLRHVHRLGSKTWSAGRLVLLASFIIGVLVVPRPGRDAQVFGAGVFVGFLLIAAYLPIAMRRQRPRPGGSWLCPHEMQLTDGGVHVQTPHWTCDVPWHGILSVEETGGHCFFRIDTISMYVIPKRAFASDLAAQQFIDFAHTCVSRSRGAQTAAT